MQPVTIKDIDRILNEFGMPQDLADLLEGMAHRIMVLSDNDTLMDKDNVLVGREGRYKRRGILHAGSYASGSISGEDIITMFETVGAIVNCEDCKLDAHLAHALGTAAHEHEGDCHLDDCQAANRWRDSREEMVNDLWQHVNDIHTPNGYYFGLNEEADGSDYGIWKTEDER